MWPGDRTDLSLRFAVVSIWFESLRSKQEDCAACTVLVAWWQTELRESLLPVSYFALINALTSHLPPLQRRLEASAWAWPGVKMLWQIPAGPPGGSGGAFSSRRARGSASRCRHQGRLRVCFCGCQWVVEMWWIRTERKTNLPPVGAHLNVAQAVLVLKTEGYELNLQL